MKKSFEEFIKEGIAKRISPDKQRAEDLVLESERKYGVLGVRLTNIHPNFLTM